MTEYEFKQFFNNNFDSLRSYLFYRSGDKELSTDLAQDTFVRLWEKQVKDEGKKTVGLAYKIASDLFISNYRKSNVEANYIDSLEFKFSNNTPEKEMEYNELKSKYEHSLANLGEKQRVVFLMSRMEGMKYSEIAEKLGISVKAVEKRMNVALSTFRAVLKILIYLIYLSTLGENITLLFNNIKTQIL